MFYDADLNDDKIISVREFKISKIMKAILQLDEEEDINKIRDYFSYEHFYVLYVRMWELDDDHDFILKKEDFAHYEGYALSSKTIDRIFA